MERERIPFVPQGMCLTGGANERSPADKGLELQWQTKINEELGKLVPYHDLFAKQALPPKT